MERTHVFSLRYTNTVTGQYQLVLFENEDYSVAQEMVGKYRRRILDPNRVAPSWNEPNFSEAYEGEILRERLHNTTFYGMKPVKTLWGPHLIKD